MDNLQEEVMEIWKPIAGYDGLYSVSSFGRVRRDSVGYNVPAGKILAGGKDERGYQLVNLWKDGKGHTLKVHKLVATMFLGIAPEGLQVNHIDGKKSNNRVENLEYVTCKENCVHANRIGLRSGMKGERNGFSKLSSIDVIAIREKYSLPMTTRQLADEYGVSIDNIRLIVKNRVWKHLLNTSA